MRFIIAALGLGLCIATASAALASVERIDIYTNRCAQNFFTGSGVGAGHVACQDGMRLGILGKETERYLFQDPRSGENNFESLGYQQAYPWACGLEVLRVSCSRDLNSAGFALARSVSNEFPVRVTLANDFAGGTSLSGFAAYAELDGSCRPGLVPIWQIRATLPAFTLDNSNFVADLQVESRVTSGFHVEPLELVWLQNSNVCAGGVCPLPSGALTTVSVAEFIAVAPKLCALPSSAP